MCKSGSGEDVSEVRRRRLEEESEVGGAKDEEMGMDSAGEKRKGEGELLGGIDEQGKGVLR